MSEKRPTEEAGESTTKTEGFEELQARRLSWAGLIFIYAGMGTLAMAVVVASVILVIGEIYPDWAVECFAYYGLPLVLVVASAMFSGFGYLVLRTVRPPSPPRLQGGAEKEPKTRRRRS
jgi:hypothetical protein